MRHTEYSVNGILPFSSNDPNQDKRNPNGIYHSIGITGQLLGKPLTGQTSKVRAMHLVKSTASRWWCR